jgi:hypothetical protein
MTPVRYLQGRQQQRTTGSSRVAAAPASALVVVVVALAAALSQPHRVGATTAAAPDMVAAARKGKLKAVKRALGSGTDPDGTDKVQQPVAAAASLALLPAFTLLLRCAATMSSCGLRCAPAAGIYSAAYGGTTRA